MAFDPRSLERLRQLGRSLPQPLPQPEAPRPSKASAPRHALETETDPEALFRELMQASPDGTVPPHLMARLRQLESGRQQQAERPAGSQPGKASPQGSHSREQQDLYTAFQQMLLEDEGEGSP
jgi:hypothetical protein